MIRKLLRPTVFAVALSMMSAGMASAEIRGLEILVPAAPGSGADQTARAMSEALQQDDLASRIQITNIPGAGGTIGLAQFVTSKKGKGNAVMVTFYVMIGAIAANKPPVTLDDVTPLARLSGEYEVIVVSANSPIRSMSDLVEKFKADPNQFPGAAAELPVSTTFWPGRSPRRLALIRARLTTSRTLVAARR